jgi:hypothetical protein
MVNENTKKKHWNELESELKTLAKSIAYTKIYTLKNKGIIIEYYFCQAIMELAHFLRTSTLATELAGQHHRLKIVFKYLKYEDDG